MSALSAPQANINLFFSTYQTMKPAARMKNIRNASTLFAGIKNRGKKTPCKSRAVEQIILISTVHISV